MKKWYQKDKNEIESELQSSNKGLTKKEAKQRLLKNGKNELPKKKNDSIIKIFFRQLLDPIVILLVITVILSLVVKEYVDAIAIIFIILIDLLMGTFQEWKAEKNAEALSQMIKVNVQVLRDGKEITIDSSNLVVGDIVLLDSGDKISADMRILECHNLQVDESVLTGESTSVTKEHKTFSQELPLAEQKNMAFAGTTVLTGRAIAIVVATGLETEIGHIARKVTDTKESESPLTIRMNKFSKQISMLIIIIAIIITFLLISKGENANTIFLSVIALAVSAMPEGLPLALTMALTVASNKMGKKKVIVKKLNHVESLGSCTVIASDKTGTLTMNEQTAKKIVLPHQVYNVSGIGYNDEGEIKGENKDSSNAIYLSKLGYFNNEATLVKEENKWQVTGDSIDAAFLALGRKAKVEKENIKVLAAIPYESENKFSAIFYKENEEIRCTVKGSIEKVLSFSNKMKTDKVVPLEKDQLLKQNEDLAREGYRVIAVADGKVDNWVEKNDYDEKDIPNLTYIGMVGFIDPVREEAKSSIEECKEAGIKVIMITGDHPLTAYAIAKELGIAKDQSEVTTGIDIKEILEQGKEKFDSFVKNKTVFTRVTPLDKLEIVESLRRQGEFVAVTGDGVNDAPALKSANIGVAMGSGTDVAKETASMIILDDNFKSIVSGIKEGRTAYSNIRKVSYMLLSCGLAEVLFFILSILLNLPMPLVAIQLLWLNIVTDGLQDFALSFEKTEPSIMKQKPRSPKESIFNKELFSEVFISGLFIGLIVFGVWFYLIRIVGMDTYIARGHILVLMVFMQNIHVLNCRSEKESAFKISLRSNPLIAFSIIGSIILQIIIMEVPLFSTFLQTTTVPISTMIILFLLSCIILIVMEIYKVIKRNKVCKQN